MVLFIISLQTRLFPKLDARNFGFMLCIVLIKTTNLTPDVWCLRIEKFMLIIIFSGGNLLNYKWKILTKNINNKKNKNSTFHWKHQITKKFFSVLLWVWNCGQVKTISFVGFALFCQKFIKIWLFHETNTPIKTHVYFWNHMLLFLLKFLHFIHPGIHIC